MTETPARAFSAVLSVTMPRTTWLFWADPAKAARTKGGSRRLHFFMVFGVFRHKHSRLSKAPQWKRRELWSWRRGPAFIVPGAWLEFVFLGHALGKQQNRI